jgi:hypothetical protein|tara:strand:+ start:379 stop:768 length:390 start_codon:yes stop_codon:yes gene_type:complete
LAALTAIKLWAHFFSIYLAIFVFVQGSERLCSVFQFIRTQCAVFILVNRLHDRIRRSKATTSSKAASTLVAATKSPALTGTIGTFTTTLARSTRGITLLASEKFLCLFAAGAFVLIQPSVAVLIELLQH